MSWLRKPLNFYLKLTEKRFLARATDHEDIRRNLEFKSKFLFHPPFGTRIVKDMFGTVPGLRVSPRQPQPGAPLILYFHGGGYVFGSPRTHKTMIGRLCAYAGAEAAMPAYRLAPENKFPAAVEDAIAAYEAVANHPDGVVIGGDSAGGGLALVLLSEILRLGLPKPRGVFAFSPLTDLAFSGDSMIRNKEAEAMLPGDRVHELAEYYLGEADPTDPLATPLNAGFKGAPPVWMTVGDTEILLDDTRRMTERLREQGVETEEIIEMDLPHVWPFFHNLLPEARTTLRAVSDWISRLPSPTDS